MLPPYCCQVFWSPAFSVALSTCSVCRSIACVHARWVSYRCNMLIFYLCALFIFLWQDYWEEKVGRLRSEVLNVYVRSWSAEDYLFWMYLFLMDLHLFILTIWVNQSSWEVCVHVCFKGSGEVNIGVCVSHMCLVLCLGADAADAPNIHLFTACVSTKQNTHITCDVWSWSSINNNK